MSEGTGRMQDVVRWFFVVFGAAVFLAALAAHASTFLGIDPMDEVPGVMWIHLLVFVPFGAGFIFEGGGKRMWSEKYAPRWLSWLMRATFAYALGNFLVFMFVMLLAGGGGPVQEGSKFFMRGKGHSREITEAEFHSYRRWVVRGFSGHWMLFTSAGLVMLVGSARGPMTSHARRVESLD